MQALKWRYLLIRSITIVAGNSNPHELKQVAGTTEKPAKASLKEKLEAYKAQVAGMGNTGTDKTKGKEAVI